MGHNLLFVLSSSLLSCVILFSSFSVSEQRIFSFFGREMGFDQLLEAKLPLLAYTARFNIKDSTFRSLTA
jgi:hypothetical protein